MNSLPFVYAVTCAFYEPSAVGVEPMFAPWRQPTGIFLWPKEDKVVLIGEEFWEKVGGLGTYRAFIEAVNEIGREYKDRIYREFLGIEPPSDAYEVNL